jgi:hypothetical protein
MADVSEEEVDDWVDAIARLHGITVEGSGDGRAAEEAAANLLSELGYQDAPMHILQMFSQAIEIGYATALRHVRDGRFDDDIRQWRPDLAES